MMTAQKSKVRLRFMTMLSSVPILPWRSFDWFGSLSNMMGIESCSAQLDQLVYNNFEAYSNFN